MKRILYSLLLGLVPLLTQAEDPGSPKAVEKKKTIIKLFDVSSKDNVVLDNQFGDVTIGLWTKNEVRIQITITANSDSDERIQRYFDAVTVDDKRSNDQIIVRTNFSQNSLNNWSLNSWKSSGEQNFIKINYEVMMPKQNALSVRNKFGNIIIPTFQAPLTVYCRHGNFKAGELTSRQNNIDVAYGRTDIRNLDEGKLDIAYATLDLVKANVLVLTNKNGKVDINDVGRLDADINYSGATIGTLRESGKIKLDFSNGFRIEQLPKTADNVNIQAAYSSVALPIDHDNDCDFDVTVSYGNFNYGSGSALHFTSQPNDDNRRGPRMVKQYVGKVGSGSGPKVRVVATYGNVNFK